MGATGTAGTSVTTGGGITGSGVGAGVASASGDATDSCGGAVSTAAGTASGTVCGGGVNASVSRVTVGSIARNRCSLCAADEFVAGDRRARNDRAASSISALGTRVGAAVDVGVGTTSAAGNGAGSGVAGGVVFTIGDSFTAGTPRNRCMADGIVPPVRRRIAAFVGVYTASCTTTSAVMVVNATVNAWICFHILSGRSPSLFVRIPYPVVQPKRRRGGGCQCQAGG